MPLVTPFWFKQRQAKAEEAGPNLYKVSGPNLREGFIGIRAGDNGQWQSFVRAAADGSDVAATSPSIPTAYDAWEAAFELYRNHFII